MVTVVGIVSLAASNAMVCEDIFSCTVMGSIGTYIIAQWLNEWFDN